MKMKKDLVSIIIPVYNSSKYLKKCLDSIVAQSYDNIEIIAVLNGSTDNSEQILKECNQKIKICKLIEPSIGMARNYGIDASTGNYIIFFDSDDYMEKDMIKELVEKMQKEDLDLGTSDYYTSDENNNRKIVNTYDFAVSNIYLSKELFYKINYGPVKLFKRSIILENKIKFPINLKYEDLPFVSEYLLKCKRIGKVNLPLYNYVIHSGSEQNTIDKRALDIFEIMKTINKKCNNCSIDLVSLNVKTIITYTLKQKYQKDSKVKNQFIKDAFHFLNQQFPRWKKCDYLKEEPFLKRIIKKSQILIKIYCNI